MNLKVEIKKYLYELHGYDEGEQPILDGQIEETATRLLKLFRDKAKVTGETSDGYHTFNELYDYREAYNAALFNEWATQHKYKVHKSWKHYDGEPCFGGGWFIVMAELPTGQISNHYEAKYWDDFKVPEETIAAEWDGHTPCEALQRLRTTEATK